MTTRPKGIILNYPAAISWTALTSSSASSSVLYGANPTLTQPPIRSTPTLWASVSA